MSSKTADHFFIIASSCFPRMIDLYNTLLEKNAPDMIRVADRTRSHAERTDIKRGAFEGKPNVKRIRR
jgi:hypothetical protein